MPDHRHSLPLPVLLSLLMLTQTFGWGVNVSLLGVLAAPAGADLGLSPAVVYGGATALFLCAAATGPAAGRAVDRFGGPRVLAFGSVVPAMALTLMALAQGPVLWLLAWALQGVATHVALATAAYGTLAQQAGGRARRAIGTLTLATGLCATVMWPVSSLVMHEVGWRGMCLVYAGATLAIVLPIHLWISLRAGPRATPETASASASTPLAGSAGVFRLVTVFQTVSVVVGTSLMVLLIDIFTALGTPRPQAIFAASLVGVAYLVSRAMLVAIGERLPPVTLAAAVLVAMPLSLAPLVLWPLSGAPLPA